MLRFVIYDFSLQLVDQFTVKLSHFFFPDFRKYDLIFPDLMGLLLQFVSACLMRAIATENNAK